jgi:hypothetical protein
MEDYFTEGRVVVYQHTSNVCGDADVLRVVFLCDKASKRLKNDKEVKNTIRRHILVCSHCEQQLVSLVPIIINVPKYIDKKNNVMR